MTCETDLPMVVARAILDDTFRESLTKDTAKTLKVAGLAVNPSELRAIEELNAEDWKSMTLRELGDRIGQLADVRVTRVVITE